LVDASVRRIPHARITLVAVARAAAEIGGRASPRGEPQPPLATTGHAKAARSLKEKLMASVSQCNDIEACGWREIAAELLPKHEQAPMPSLTESLAMHLAVGDGAASVRPKQQVRAAPSSRHRCARMHTHACDLCARRRCSRR